MEMWTSFTTVVIEFAVIGIGLVFFVLEGGAEAGFWHPEKTRMIKVSV